MSEYNKIYPQSGPQGDVPGWRPFVEEMNRNGRYVTAAVSDTMSLLDDLQEMGRKFGVPNRGNFRPTGYLSVREMKKLDPNWQDSWGSYHLAVPVYNIYGSKEAAEVVYKRSASLHVRAVLTRVPQNLDREMVSVSSWNEIRPYKGWEAADNPEAKGWGLRIDGYTGWADVIGRQAWHIGKELVRRKDAGEPWFRWAAFAFAGGNPEEGVWEQPGMLDYLRLCAERPDVCGVALHEYSFIQDVWREFGERNFIGRFEKLFDVCDARGIKRPWVEIKEWGWEERDIPNKQIALREIAECARYYALYPEIKLAAIWTANNGWGAASGKVPLLMDGLYEFALSEKGRFSSPDAPPAPDPTQPTERPLPAKVRHTVHLLPQSYTLAEFTAVCQHLYPQRTTFAFSHDAADAVMYAGKDDSKVVGWDVGRWDFDVEAFFVERGVVFEQRSVAELAPTPPTNPEPADPLQGLVLGRILSKPYVMTSPFGAPRTYNGKPERHEGVDFDVTEAVANSQAAVLAVLAGTVTAVYRRAGGYGLRVIVESEYNGIKLVSWYGHLDQAFVSKGQKVALGAPLGEVGSSGWVTGEHVHYTLQAIGHGLSGYVLPDVVDSAPYFDHDAVVPPAGGSYDMAKYFLPPGGRQYGDIFILKNSWSGGNERVQVQRHNGDSFIVKNQSFEQRRIDDRHIRLLMDTSPGDGQYYTVKGVWMPRRWQVGQSFTRTEFVEWFWKSNCQPVLGKPSQNYISKLKFGQHWQEWVAPKSGIVLKDVVKLHWEINGRVDEEYWFAAGLGLVRWRKYDGRESWIHELIPVGSQGNNARERLAC